MVPRGLILGPLLFNTFINDIPANLESNVKIFTDDASFFSLVCDPNESSPKLGRDLGRVAEWTYQWKIPVGTPPVCFNNLAVASCETHKRLGLLLNKRLAFDCHAEEMILRVNKGMRLITRLRRYLPRNSLFTIYKTFIRPHLDYGDVVYDYTGDASFMQKLKSIQYNSSLAITGCFRSMSRDKLYSELVLKV